VEKLLGSEDKENKDVQT